MNYDNDIYFDRIKPLFDNSGETATDLERNIGIPAKKISQWNIRYTKSYAKYIPQIASYFHVSTDYLLGNTDDPTPAGQKETSPVVSNEERLDKELISRLCRLTPEEREKVDAFVQGLLASR